MSKLTIVVAIYNVENYLYKCLSSLKEQSFSDYQVFCINDGSTDQSRNIIQEFVENDPRFFLFDKKNGGLSDARNFGLTKTSSEYVAFIDGDDFVEPDYVKQSLKAMEDGNLDMLVFAYKQYYLASGTAEVTNLRIADGIYNLKDKPELLAYTPNAAWNKVYKTDLFKKNNIEYPFGYRHQDLGTTPKLLLKSTRVGYLNLPLYNYLIDRPNNITDQIDKKLYHIADMAKEILDYYKEQNCYNSYVDELEYLIRRNFIQSLRKAMRLQDLHFVLKFIDDLFDLSDIYFKDSQHRYQLAEERSDEVYLSRFKCKLYYLSRRIRQLIRRTDG